MSPRRSKPTDEQPTIPAHVEDTMQAIARLHVDHYRSAPRLQRMLDRITAAAGRPRVVIALTLVILAWVVMNIVALSMGRQPLDAPPFAWLETAATLVALFTTLLILTTQRREDQLATRRDRLTLELAVLNDRKSAKIIQLLEELRRDAPTLANRVDHEAAEMSRPSDPQSIHEALDDTEEELGRTLQQVAPTTRAPE